MDLASIAATASAIKTGLDTVKTALGLVKDVQTALPAGAKKDAAGESLKEAEKKLRIGEAQIAQALGYSLCKCEFPPTPMVLVGFQTSRLKNSTARKDVFECPKCKRTRPPGSYLTDGRTIVVSSGR